MDQNLEGKDDVEERKLTAVHVPPEDVGIYFLGDSHPSSFVGYIVEAMTDEQIQEYIDAQERLKPPCMRKQAPQSETPVKNTNVNAGGSPSGAARALETVVEVEEEDNTNVNATSSPSKTAGTLQTIPEADEEADA